MVEFFTTTMSSKEKVKDFNQWFTTILNKFQPEAKPTQGLQIEVYANCWNTYNPKLLSFTFSTSWNYNFSQNGNLEENFWILNQIQFWLISNKACVISVVDEFFPFDRTTISSLEFWSRLIFKDVNH